MEGGSGQSGKLRGPGREAYIEIKVQANRVIGRCMALLSCLTYWHPPYFFPHLFSCPGATSRDYLRGEGKGGWWI